ncbi:hypothetical protein JCGZ_13228 [Jatropha curcas]|uniref:Uncharacterized protein n=1 Tax=Jatropha curcas TaxID=180498 RepID=A0A067KBD2_JATCU|nr:hypothetical protein JCGZ_13228 [Jatropha curcas]
MLEEFCLAPLAKEQGNNNVAFFSLFVLSKANKCLQLLISREKSCESLADPKEFPNLVEDWQLTLAFESKIPREQGTYLPAEQYLTNAESLTSTSFRVSNACKLRRKHATQNGDLDNEILGVLGNDDNDAEKAIQGDPEPAKSVMVVDGNDGEQVMHQ